MIEEGSMYECIEEFMCDEYDDEGNELLEEDRIVKKGTIWQVEWAVNDWVRLCESTDETVYSWLEISTKRLNTHFKYIR